MSCICRYSEKSLRLLISPYGLNDIQLVFRKSSKAGHDIKRQSEPMFILRYEGE